MNDSIFRLTQYPEWAALVRLLRESDAQAVERIRGDDMEAGAITIQANDHFRALIRTLLVNSDEKHRDPFQENQ